MINPNDTSDWTSTDYGNYDSTVTLTYSNPYYHDEYEPNTTIEELNEIRSGWNNPRKIQINNKHTHKYTRIQIRNCLPYKMREVDN